MIIEIGVIDDPNGVAALQDQVATLEWRDGAQTAGSMAKTVKRNLQAVLEDGEGPALRKTIMRCLADNALLKMAARPRRYSNILISKTSNGGYYGPHVDNALMGSEGARMRSDLSFTLFLNEPNAYEGGELIVHGPSISHSIKGKAGQLVLYPSSSIHEVRPVTAGERLVCVGWIESLVADTDQRGVLFDLEACRAELRKTSQSDAATLLRLDKAIANLSRMWSLP